MRNTNKKGFTIVELVIVIAVIAILAAVLIPTFSSIIKKANIASDTAVAKNLNTAAISAGAKDFDSAIEAVKDAGYLLANLNAKADGCYFVWDDANDQFLLVDTTDSYKVIYSNTDASEKSNWYVAVSDPEAIANIKAAGCQVKKIAASYEDLMANIAAGGEVYVDESVVIDENNLIYIDDAEKVVTINLGNASLNTNGILTSGLGKWTLPNTGIYVTFGSDFFLHPAGEHFEEFRGYYPDIWVPAAEAEEAVMNFIAQNTMAAE